VVVSVLGRPRTAIAPGRGAGALVRRGGPRVHPRLAAASAALGRAGEHERWLRGIVDEQPDDLEARLALARVLAARGAADEAEAELRAALEREPDALGPHLALGRLLLAEGRAEAAAKAHEELLGVLERRADLDGSRDGVEADLFA
jgi:hypothetical protein